MAEQAQPSELLRVPLWFPVVEPFGVLDYATEDAIYETPFLSAMYGSDEGEPEKVLFHWYNSTLRFFKSSPESNHLDFRTDEGKLQGVRLSADLLEAMDEMHYPKHELPILAMDTASVQWLASRAMTDIDTEWDSLDD